MKTLFRPVLIVLATIVVVVLILLSPIVPGYWFTDIQTIDSDFDGLFSSKPLDRGKPDITAGSKERNISVLMVHGIGRHCIGYADELVSKIAKHGGLTHASPGQEIFSPKGCDDKIADYNQFDIDQDKVCERIHDQKGTNDRDCQRLKLTVSLDSPASGQNKKSNFFTGYIRTQDYRLPSAESHAPVNLRLYELTWDAATRWAKSHYVIDPDSEFDDSRERVNRDIKKQIINESITDAVLYLGDYRPFLQYPLLMVFCKMVSDMGFDAPPKDGYDFECNFQEIKDRLENNRSTESEIVIFTHSLGTSMPIRMLHKMQSTNSYQRLLR